MTGPDPAADAPGGAWPDVAGPVTYPPAAPVNGPTTGQDEPGSEQDMTAAAHGTRHRGRKARRGPRQAADAPRPRQSNIAVPLPTHAALQAVQRRLGFARDRWVTLGETIDELIKLSEPGLTELVTELRRQADDFQAAREGS